MTTVRRRVGQVERAVRRSLRDLDAGWPGVAGSPEGEAVVVLARDLDAGVDQPLSSRVAAAREIREALAALRAAAPEDAGADRLDELAARRDRRRAS